MSDSILQAGLQGVQGGVDQFGRASHQVTTATSTSSNGYSVTEGLVEVKQAQRTIEASAAVIKVADQINEYLLDELA